MNEIRAFVGHSFTDDDTEVVNIFLKYFERLSALHTTFKWEHAERAEPRIIAEKVMSLIADKNVFIGICTKKEQTVQSAFLKRCFYPKGFLKAKADAFEWKTSDWILQEIGLAKGRGLEIILLKEVGLRNDTGLESDIEYIEFDRAAPEKSFNKILEMLIALSPKNLTIGGGVTTDVKPEMDDEQKASTQDNNTDWKTPKSEWSHDEYETAFVRMLIDKDEIAAENISTAYLKSSYAVEDDNKNVWIARCEYLRVLLGRGGNLDNLKAFTVSNPNNSAVWYYLARGYAVYEDYTNAASTYETAAKHAKNVSWRLELLSDAAKAYTKTGAVKAATNIINEMKTLAPAGGLEEIALLRTLKEVAEAKKEDNLVLGATERILELNPSDINMRFSLAHKYKEVGNSELSLFHYLKIPYQEREPATWNNLGVTYEALELAAKSVESYRRAEKAGETLAMSNLAQKLITAGFIPEAQEKCDSALQIQDYHKNILSAMTRLKELPNKEEKKEAEVIEKARPLSNFYMKYGHALSLTEPSSLPQHWKGLVCSLDVILTNSEFEAKGNYEEQPSALSGFFTATYGLGGPKPIPESYQIRYYGSFRGRAIEGFVIREKQGESKKVSSILGSIENRTPVLMILSEDGNKIRVMEGKQGSKPLFYSLKVIAPLN